MAQRAIKDTKYKLGVSFTRTGSVIEEIQQSADDVEEEIENMKTDRSMLKEEKPKPIKTPVRHNENDHT